MADALGTLGEPVLDRTLVPNVLCGLDERYSHMAAMIKRTCPFPSYSDVRADLLIEVVALASKSSTPMAFVASSSSHPLQPRSRGSGASAGQGQGGQGHGRQHPGGLEQLWWRIGQPGASTLACQYGWSRYGWSPSWSLADTLEPSHRDLCRLAWTARRSSAPSARASASLSSGFRRQYACTMAAVLPRPPVQQQQQKQFASWSPAVAAVRWFVHPYLHLRRSIFGPGSIILDMGPVGLGAQF